MAKECEGRRKRKGMGRKVKKATIELDGCLQVEGSTPSILTLYLLPPKVKTRIPRVYINDFFFRRLNTSWAIAKMYSTSTGRSEGATSGLVRARKSSCVTFYSDLKPDLGISGLTAPQMTLTLTR